MDDDTGGGTSGAAGGGCDTVEEEEGVAGGLAVAPAVGLLDAEGPELPTNRQNMYTFLTFLRLHTAHLEEKMNTMHWLDKI